MTTKMSLLEHVAVLAFTVHVLASNVAHQPIIEVNGGYGWDGVYYHQMLDAFEGAPLQSYKYPFCKRAAVPYLAHLTGVDDPRAAFRLVNLAAAVLLSWVLYAIARAAGFGVWHGAFAVLLGVVPFFSPARFVPFYPVYTDPPFLALVGLGFLFLIRQHVALALACLVAAFPVREAAAHLLPFFFLASVLLDGRPGRKALYTLLAGVAMLLIAIAIRRHFPCNGSQLDTARAWHEARLRHPHGFIQYCAGIAMTVAPLVLIRNVPQLSGIERVSLAGALLAAVLAWLGGADVTRVFYSFLPIYVLAILAVVRSGGLPLAACCLAGYALTSSFGEKILQPAAAAPNQDTTGYFAQYPDLAHVSVALSVLGVWLVVLVVHEKLLAERRA